MQIGTSTTTPILTTVSGTNRMRRRAVGLRADFEDSSAPSMAHCRSIRFGVYAQALSASALEKIKQQAGRDADVILGIIPRATKHAGSRLSQSDAPFCLLMSLLGHTGATYARNGLRQNPIL
jgi:hypothetical protein